MSSCSTGYIFIQRYYDRRHQECIAKFCSFLNLPLLPLLQLPDLVQCPGYHVTHNGHQSSLASIGIRIFKGFVFVWNHSYRYIGVDLINAFAKQSDDLIGSPAMQTVLHLEGLMTHLADADNEDARHTEAQLARFQQSLEVIQYRGFALPLVHAANSAAIVKYPASRYSLVRPGIMLYGYQTAAQRASTSEVRPILTWKTTVAHLHSIQPGNSVSYNRTFIASRPSRIAVLPVGYADGYNRLLSNRGVVLIAGRRAPVVGRVCMDMIMIDVTDVPGVDIGHEAILIGQQGQERITAADLASWQQTIPYEILCAIGPRVPRQHIPLPAGSTTS